MTTHTIADDFGNSITFEGDEDGFIDFDAAWAICELRRDAPKLDDVFGRAVEFHKHGDLAFVLCDVGGTTIDWWDNEGELEEPRHRWRYSLDSCPFSGYFTIDGAEL